MKKSMKIVMEKCFCVLPNSKCDIKAIPLEQVERLAILIAFITILKTRKKNKNHIVLEAPRGQSQERSLFVLPDTETSLSQEGTLSHRLCGKIYFATHGRAFIQKFWPCVPCLRSRFKREWWYRGGISVHPPDWGKD